MSEAAALCGEPALRLASHKPAIPIPRRGIVSGSGIGAIMIISTFVGENSEPPISKQDGNGQ